MQGVAEDMTGLIERIEVHAAEQKDETFVIVDGGGSQLAVAVAIGGIAAEDDGVAAVGGAEVHAKAVGEADEFVPGLGCA